MRREIIGALALAALTGCGSGGGGTTANGAGANIPGVPLGTLTTNPLTFAEMEKMVGGEFFIRADRGLTPAMKYPATLNGTDGTGGYRIGWLTTPLVIGSGDSGSPVYDANGSVAGALAYGSYGNDSFFGVTSIEDMKWAAEHESEDVGIARAAGDRSTLGGYAMSGLNGRRLELMEKRNPAVAARINRFRQFGLDATRGAKPSMSGRAGSTLTPGETFAVMIVEGPHLLAYGYGSVTYPYKGRYLCWGHPMLWGGPKQDYPVKRAGFVSQVPGTLGSYKMAVPYGSAIGTLTSDLKYCVVVDTRVAATPIPVSYTYTIGNRTSSSTPETIYKVARMEPIDVLVYSSVGPIETLAHQLGAFDLYGSGNIKIVVRFKDGTTEEHESTVYESSQVLGDLWFGILFEDWTFRKPDVAKIESIDVTILVSDKPTTPPEDGGGGGEG